MGYTYNQERNKSAIDSVKQESLIPANPTTQKEAAPVAPTAPIAPATQNQTPESK